MDSYTQDRAQLESEGVSPHCLPPVRYNTARHLPSFASRKQQLLFVQYPPSALTPPLGPDVGPRPAFFASFYAGLENSEKQPWK